MKQMKTRMKTPGKPYFSAGLASTGGRRDRQSRERDDHVIDTLHAMQLLVVTLLVAAGSGLGFVDTREVETNRCSDLKSMSMFARGLSCGSPLAQPCFDFGRCTNTSGIYVYDADCSLADSSTMLAANGTAVGQEKGDPHQIGWVFRNAARKAGVLAESYESACMFMHVTAVGKRVNDEQFHCPIRSPLWNNGNNHVMIDFGDDGREHRADVADSFAMDAASNMHSCLYRSGYDVSLPLAPKKHFHHLAEIAPLDREFRLTFKGTAYLSGHGSEERLSVVPLHNEEHGVVISVLCFEKHNEHLLTQNFGYCQSLKHRVYEQHYNYSTLMNTTFGLVPSGRSPGTYRLAEVMGAGAIPVIVARDVVLPFREHIDWPSFSFTFPPDQVGPYMIKQLQAVSRTQLEQMQRRSLQAYRGMFGYDDSLEGPSAFEPIARNLISIMLRRIGHRGG